MYRVVGPDGQRISFAELLLGNSRFFVVDEFPEQHAFSPISLGGTPVALHVYVPDVDSAYARAIRVGMTVEIPLADFFWGERYCSLHDPFGHHWALASRIEDLSPGGDPTPRQRLLRPRSLIATWRLTEIPLRYIHIRYNHLGVGYDQNARRAANMGATTPIVAIRATMRCTDLKIPWLNPPFTALCFARVSQRRRLTIAFVRDSLP